MKVFSGWRSLFIILIFKDCLCCQGLITLLRHLFNSGKESIKREQTLLCLNPILIQFLGFNVIVVCASYFTSYQFPVSFIGRGKLSFSSLLFFISVEEPIFSSKTYSTADLENGLGPWEAPWKWWGPFCDFHLATVFPAPTGGLSIKAHHARAVLGTVLFILSCSGLLGYTFATPDKL